MFKHAVVLLLLLYLGQGQQQRQPGDGGPAPHEKFSGLIGSDRLCASLCTRRADAGLDPASAICNCDLYDGPGDDSDLQTLTNEGQALGTPLQKSEKTDVQKREVDNEYFIGQHFSKKPTGKPTRQKLSTRVPTPWKSKLSKKGKQQSLSTTRRPSVKPKKKFTPNPKLAQIHHQVEELKERLRAPRLGQRAGFGLEDLEERHKKVVKEMKEKHKQMLETHSKDHEKIIGYPLKKTVKTEKEKKTADAKKEPMLSSSHQFKAEDNSRAKKEKAEIVGAAQQSTTSTTAIPKSAASRLQEPMSSSTPSNTASQQSASKPPLSPRVILTHVKEKISENKNKLQNRLSSEAVGNTKLTNVLEKNREAVSSTLKQIKEKQDKIKSRLASSTTSKVGIITQDPKLYQ